MVKTTARNMLLALTTAALTFTSCSKHRVKTTVPQLNRTFQFVQTKNDLRITVRKLEANNYNIFTKKTLCKKYIPIEFTIENRGNDSFKFSNQRIGLKFVDVENIIKKLHKNPWLTFIWPLAIMDVVKIHILILSGILIKHLGTTSISLQRPLIPVISTLALSSIYSLTSYDNKKITTQILNKIIDSHDTVFISPKSSVTKIAYIRKRNFKSKFFITLIKSLNEDHIRFFIDLEKLSFSKVLDLENEK
ncbi:hypothetical protein KAW80_01465 [Candidatus Babeliales bacterium]|nr:hypothetical protein [Candidatus Babeliales bacterium]